MTSQRLAACVLLCILAVVVMTVAAAGDGPAGNRPAGNRPAGNRPAGNRPALSGKDRPIAAPPKVDQAVQRVLKVQADAWNRGDIDGFMEHYWKSEQLTFSSGGKTTRGWKATLDNYKRRYPTRDKMGKVQFDRIEVFPLGSSAALVLGRWQLTRKDDPIGGNFSLVFRRIDKRWLIIHDHTSLKQNK